MAVACWTNFRAKALAFKLMGSKLSSSYYYTFMYAPSAERFIGQRLMNVAHPQKLNRKSARARIYHLNQFSHASSCSSNGIFSLTQGLHVDGRLASLPSSLCMWAMIIPFARCQVSVTCSFPGCLASPHICLRPPQGLASFSPHLLLLFALTLAVGRPTCRLADEHTVSKAESAGTLSRAC